MPTPGTTTKRAADGRKRMKHGVHIDKNKAGGFYFRTAGRNGHVLDKSSECYTRKLNVRKAMVATRDALNKALMEPEKYLHDHTLVVKKAAKKKA